MPYKDGSDPSLPEYVLNLTARKRRQWVNVFNSSYRSCQKSGKGDCEAMAFKSANSVVKATEAASKNPDDFLVVEDPEKPTTYHLQVMDGGKPNHRLMGAAWAALMNPNGYRGNKYEGPDKAKALAKLKKMYKDEDMPMPKEDAAESSELTEMGDMEYSMHYVPPGITSFADLDAAQEAFEAATEIQERVSQLVRMIWNIFDSQMIEDKLGAFQGLVGEFVSIMSDATSNVAGAELSEAATIKAKAKGAINALSTLLADKTLPKDLGEKIESLRSALRQNWKDLETLANDEKDETEESTGVGEKLCETWSGPITIQEAEPTPDSLLSLNVGLIRAGWGNSKDNHYYSTQTLQDSASKFVGAKMYETDHRPGEKSTRTWVSTVQNIVGLADDGTLVARVVAHDPNFAERVRNLNKAGLLEKMECSILAEGKAGPKFSENGRSGKSILEITGVESVDWVTRAGAGGRALSLAESETGETSMEEETQVETTQEGEPETPPAAPVAENVTITETQTPAAETVASPPVTGGTVVPLDGSTAATPAPLEAAQVVETLAASSLPKTAQARLAERNYTSSDDLNAAIAAERDYIKTILGAGRPKDSGVTTPPAPAKTSLAEKQDAIDRRYGLRH